MCTRTTNPSGSPGPPLALAVLLTAVAGVPITASAQADLAAYGSVRFAAQHADDNHAAPPVEPPPRDRARDSESGFRNYQSRVGARYSIATPWAGDRTAAFVHGELGSERNRLALRKRLLYAGVRSAYGTLSYGKQWTAFYNAVGQYMDVAIDRSGFGYLGSERTEHAETLQYSTVWNLFYVQADAIRDAKIGGGFNRYQAGVDYQAAVWRLGAAIDLKEGDGPALASVNLHPDGGPPACDVPGVDCVGLSVGWRMRENSLDIGFNRVESETDHVNGGAVTFQWKPNEFGIFVEISGLRGAGSSSKTFAIGGQYAWTSYLSGFIEYSATGLGGQRSDVEHVLEAGVKVDFERFF